MIALVCALTAAMLGGGIGSATGGERAAAQKKVSVRFAGLAQSKILANGLRVRVSVKLRHRARRPAQVRISAVSATFDTPRFAKLTRPKVIKVRRSGKRLVRLRLTQAGRKAIASCEPRRLRVRAGKARATGSLRRTGACGPKPVDLSRATTCDFIATNASGIPCMLPFPNDFYTRADPTSSTGRRVAFTAAAMPDNASAKPIDPGPYLLNDGFSPGETILLRVPGLDNPAALAATDAAPINHIGRFSEPDAPVVVIDAETGERLPIWVELDSNAPSDDTRLLEIHPARNYASGHRYIVALRTLRRGDSSVIPAPEGFRYYRDDLPSQSGAVNGRRAHFETIFGALRGAGVQRSNLYLAWDFTVATDGSIAKRALYMRDNAFGALGDTNLADQVATGTSPAFQVTTVNTDPQAQIARRVRGNFTVPCYLVPDCDPGGTFQLDGNGLPARNGNYSANFDCIIPDIAVDGTPSPARAAIYGHGLFGGAAEVIGSPVNRDLANQHGFVMCATDEIGMSGNDVPNVAANVLTDLSNFPQLADRLQQGLLNELFLSRLMIHPDGFASDPAFHIDGTLGTASVIDPTQNFHIGASQGGIMGGALTALAPDFTRSVLNVPAMNYSVLLPRSVDYAPFEIFINQQYGPMERPLALDLIQMLWDRGEPNGYAHRMTDNPLPNTPAHTVLMNVAFGDHQVTNFQADVEARTIGAYARQPAIYPGRWPNVDILWDVPTIPSYPFDGSAIVYGDIGPLGYDPMNPTRGVPPPPLENIPNTAGEDPHGAPRGAPQAVQLMSDFLQTNGAVTNVCGTTACFAGGFPGP